MNSQIHQFPQLVLTDAQIDFIDLFSIHHFFSSAHDRGHTVRNNELNSLQRVRIGKFAQTIVSFVWGNSFHQPFCQRRSHPCNLEQMMQTMHHQAQLLMAIYLKASALSIPNSRMFQKDVISALETNARGEQNQ